MRSELSFLLIALVASMAPAAERTPDEAVWDLYQATRNLPLERFNRALDLLDDTDRRAVPSRFDQTRGDDAELAVFAPYWSDQIAAAAVLVASANDGGVVHLGEGPVTIAAGAFGRAPTPNDCFDAYTRTRPDGLWPAIHDPTPALFENGYYYCFATAEGMPMFRSKDRVHWRSIGAAFPKGHQPKWWNDWQPANAKKDPATGKLISGEHNPNVFVWAPHLVRHNDTYHLYYAIPASFGLHRTAAIGHATKKSLDPAVPWVDDGEPIITCTDEDPFNAIDPFFVIDREGSAWMPFGSFAPGGINLVPLDATTGMLGPGAQKPWTQIAGDGMESPCVWFDRASDRYYLFASEGFGIGPPWDYKVRVWRTDAGAPITGPYVDHEGRRALDATNQIGRGERNNNPGLILIGADGNRVAPGGQAVYLDDRDGRLYMIFHERDNSLWVGPRDRPLPAFNLQIREITFNAAGWPELGPPTMRTPDPTARPRPPVPPDRD
jgi:arabinan endo-1,5-alpha-L-arabinosidase